MGKEMIQVRSKLSDPVDIEVQLNPRKGLPWYDPETEDEEEKSERPQQASIEEIHESPLGTSQSQLGWANMGCRQSQIHSKIRRVTTQNNLKKVHYQVKIS